MPWTPWNDEPGTRNCWVYSLGGAAGDDVGNDAGGAASCCANAWPTTARASAADVQNPPNPMHFLQPTKGGADFRPAPLERPARRPRPAASCVDLSPPRPNRLRP